MTAKRKPAPRLSQRDITEIERRVSRGPASAGVSSYIAYTRQLEKDLFRLLDELKQRQTRFL